MGNYKAQALGREGQTAGGGRQRERALGARTGAHERVSPRRPRHGAGRADRHVVDPAALGIRGNDGAVSLSVNQHHLTVIAAGKDTCGVGSRGEDRAGVNGDAPRLARVRQQKECLLAEHE